MGEGENPSGVTARAEVQDPEIRRFLSESLDRIKEVLDPQALVFFGSRVEGRTHEWSDIDLFIVSRKFENMRVLPRMALFREVAQPHTHVDAICYTPDDFERMMNEPSLIREIMQSGLRII